MGGMAYNDLDLIPTAELCAALKRRCTAVFMVLMGEPKAARAGAPFRLVVTGAQETANDLKQCIEAGYSGWLEELVRRGAILAEDAGPAAAGSPPAGPEVPPS